jgi:diguanylate cyclase (GGDEF)-like protein
MTDELTERSAAPPSGLRFAEPLETECHRAQAARSADSVRLPLLLALLLVGILSVLDWQALPAELAVRTALLRLGVVAPMLGLALGATFPGPLLRHAETIRRLAATVWTAVTVSLIWLTRDTGLDGAAVAETLGLTLFLYLLLGLRWSTAAPLASTALLTILVLRTSTVSPASVYAPVLLIFVNMLAALACYRAERNARSAFIENEIVSLVVGTDAVTGISNRHSFDTHLHSVWRQARRDSKQLAVMLVEIDYHPEFVRHYGQHVANLALRRIAHAMLGCARRPLDRTARFTETRLALVLFDAAPDYLEAAANRLRSEVALLDIPNEVPEARGRLTVSIGIAAMDAAQSSSEFEVLSAALGALDGGERERHRLVIKGQADSSPSAILRGPWRNVPTGIGGR